ncbi:MAG TPA: metallophosphoesterase [Steroidobacteraceae bacterium]|nr:metallophosphoesterase [Steroidobacteraceae bacterium]
MRRLLALSWAIALAGCAAQPAAKQPIAEFLAFGDSGYHYDYLEVDDEPGPKTYEAYLEDERLEWLEDKRPPGEFRAPPAYRVPQTGSFIPASGQAAVATAMHRFCEGPAVCDFGVMLGDNIYPEGATAGADGRDDAERFRKIFHEPYSPLSSNGSQFRIYATLGNHDWKTSRAGAMAQVKYLTETRPFYMDGIRYRVAPTGDPREVEIFVLDTHVMLSDHSILDDALTDDGRELDSGKIDTPEPWAIPQNADEWGMAEWLAKSLADSPARWKIVMGHHPIWSSAGSKFHQARMMRRLILPALCRYADMYLAGHEHTLELYTDGCKDVPEAQGRPPLPQLVSGAAGKQRPLNTNFARHQLAAHPELTSLFTQGLVWGFAHVTLEADRATIRLLTTPDDQSGKPVPTYEHGFDRRSGKQ